MHKSEKQKVKENERRQRILDTAFRIFVEKKIEAVSMGEIAEAVGIGRATLFRCYSNKTELVIAVCAAQWSGSCLPARSSASCAVYASFTSVL